jgi:hypothetical protein
VALTAAAAAAAAANAITNRYCGPITTGLATSEHSKRNHSKNKNHVLQSRIPFIVEA